jgi:trans-2,3-dihydro-3-hydroxyanthranilate isomerase
MTAGLPFTTFDVFTDRRFCGNPLAIVENADNLSTEEMQRVAGEFNLSETIFMRSPADGSLDVPVRIFTPTSEIPFAGHPTVGCAIHLALSRFGDGDFEETIVLKEVAGDVPVRVVLRRGEVTAQFTAPVLPVACKAALPDAELAAKALGLATSQIGFADHGVNAFEGGPAFLYIPVGSRDALATAWPSDPDWSAMTSLTGIASVYVYCTGESASKIDFHARMFAPGHKIPEDPATGSASAILAAQLRRAGALKEGLNRFRLEQGRDMGRLSQIGLEIDVSGGAVSAVRISGCAVKVSTGTIEVR